MIDYNSSETERKYLKADLNFDNSLSTCLNNIKTFHKKFKIKNKPYHQHQTRRDRASAELTDGFKRILTPNIHIVTQGGVFMFRDNTLNFMVLGWGNIHE